MGTTGIHKYDCIRNAKGNIDKKATLDHEFSIYGDERVIKSAMAGGNYYAVLEWTNNGVLRRMLAVVKCSTDKDYFYYKEMDDTMAPYFYDCPKSILDLADELVPCNESYDPHGWAAEWREKCRENLVKKRNPLAFANVKYGDSILWNVPKGIGWSEDIEGKTLRLKKVRGKRCWVCYELWTGFKPMDVDVNDCIPA